MPKSKNNANVPSPPKSLFVISIIVNDARKKINCTNADI